MSSSSAAGESTTAKLTSTTVATSTGGGGGTGASSTTDGGLLSFTSSAAKEYDGLSKEDKQIIIGSVVGVFAVCALIFIGCMIHRRHKRQRGVTNPNAPIVITNGGGKV